MTIIEKDKFIKEQLKGKTSLEDACYYLNCRHYDTRGFFRCCKLVNMRGKYAISFYIDGDGFLDENRNQLLDLCEHISELQQIAAVEKL